MTAQIYPWPKTPRPMPPDLPEQPPLFILEEGEGDHSYLAREGRLMARYLGGCYIATMIAAYFLYASA